MGATNYPPLGSIKSIQRGVISITGANLVTTATVSPVNPARAELRHLGNRNNTFTASLRLTDSVTVTATRGSQNGVDVTTVEFELVERY